MNTPKKVALAYSGGLDTSIIIPWLKENYGCEVVAVCGDIGQGGGELKGLEAKARATGASEVYIADMREEFVSEYLWKLVRAGSEYEHKYLLGTSIARPLLAKRQVEVALETGASAPLDPDYEERAIYVVEGEIEISGDPFEGPRLLVFRAGDRITLTASLNVPKKR